MAVAALPENYLVIAGCIVGTSETRYSPAGLPIVRFVLQHHSQQIEADIAREVRCRILVLACGEALARDVQRLAAGTPVRVHGFISRANYRQGESRLVLHAKRIEILDSTEFNRG